MAHYTELSLDHLEALADFCNANCEFHQGQFEPEIIKRRIFDDPDYQNEHGFLLFHKAEIIGCMIGVVRGKEGWIKLFGIDQDYRRKGFGNLMLAELEALFKSGGCSQIHVLNAAPYYLTPGLDVRYTDAFCFLHSNGYQLNNYVHNMSVDLRKSDFDFSQSEKLLSDLGMEIERLDQQDQSKYYQWVLDTWGEGWTAESCNGLKNNPVTTFVTLDKHKEIRGFASYDVTMFRGGFGPTGVSKELRGLGIGKALLLRCLLDMKQRGYPWCEIGWVGPISFYAHTVGARICATFVQGSKKL